MNQQIPQPEKKGLSKGCTIALIVGGIILVAVVALIITLFVKGKDVAKWAYVQAVESEKALIMNSNLSGIDTVAVNKVADGFKAKVESADFEFDQVLSFQSFVQQYVTDAKVDSTEAAQFVNAMIECYPDLSDLYSPEIPMGTENPPDTIGAEGQ
jgi:hypothetical protein